VVFVANSFDKLQVFPIFPVALIGIPGEAAIQRQNHKTVGNGSKNKPGDRIPNKEIY